MKTAWRPSSVWIWRVVFVGFLCLAAALLGWGANYLLTDSETELADVQFDSIADHALSSAQSTNFRKRKGTVTMATIISQALPNAPSWPFVVLNGFEEISNDLIETSDGREMALCPFVSPTELSDFETFAYDYYESKFSNETAVSSFGKGVFGINPALGTSDNRYHETDGNTYYDSPNKLFAPVFQHNDGDHPVLMLNVHFQETRGVAIDEMIDCSETRASSGNLTMECGSITDMLTLADVPPGTGPGALIFQPIYPTNNNTVLTGVIASSIVWEEVLLDVFAEEESGIDCVLKTAGNTYTYTISNGKVLLKGEGDLHDRHFAEYGRSVSLTDGLFSDISASYTLYLYPTHEFFRTYQTNNPMIATIGAVCIIVFTSLVFYLYDFFVRKEFGAREEILEAKRRFVRFISHEVRTPLNTVCMGLSLLEEEMGSAFPQVAMSLEPHRASRSPKHSSRKKAQTQQQQQQQQQNQQRQQEQASEPDMKATPVEGADASAGAVAEAFIQQQATININTIEASTSSIASSKKGGMKLPPLITTTAPTTTAPAPINAPLLSGAAATGGGGGGGGDAATLAPNFSCWEHVGKWLTLTKEILLNTESAVDVLNDLLNYDKIETGSLSLELTVIPIWKLIENTVNEFALQAKKAKVNYIMDLKQAVIDNGDVDVFSSIDADDEALEDLVAFDARDRVIIGDKIRLTQVIRNLISNALKFTPEGGNLTVTAVWLRDKYRESTHFVLNSGEEVDYARGGTLQLCVTDSGAGMTLQQVKGVFQEGVQFNVNLLQAGQGSGLGLYITKGIVEQHKGTIRASSPGLGHGTTFSLNIPLYHVSPEAMPRSSAESSRRNSSNRSLVDRGHPQPITIIQEPVLSLHILVVDDAATNRKMLTQLLSRKHSCDEAKHGQEAIDSFVASQENGRPYHCILMDFEMPVMNGPTATKIIRELGCNCIVIGVTGNVLQEDVSYFKSCGADEVLSKPLRMAELNKLLIAYGILAEPPSASEGGVVLEKIDENHDDGDSTLMDASKKTYVEGADAAVLMGGSVNSRVTAVGGGNVDNSRPPLEDSLLF